MSIFQTIDAINTTAFANLHPVLNALQSIETGRLDVTLPAGARISYRGRNDGENAKLHVYDEHALDLIADSSDIGLGEGYMQGLWDTNNLLYLTRLLADNYDALAAPLAGSTLFRRYYAIKNLFRRNSVRGSRKNIEAHYDLGNDFYSLWLDETMTYSCALFRGNSSKPLAHAQSEKYRRILDRLGARPFAHILEVGCGWGGFIIEAAKRGFQATGVTISKEQAELANARLHHAGLTGLARVRLQDYREIRGQYDHVVSIGMMEHVGRALWPEYLTRIGQALAPGGKAMIQTIIIQDKLAAEYYDASDFVREHIFPGGALPSMRLFRAAAAAAGFAIADVFRFGQDYAITLETWLANFDARQKDIRALGFDDHFLRKWRFYLASSAAMFRAGKIDVMQVEMRKQ